MLRSSYSSTPVLQGKPPGLPLLAFQHNLALPFEFVQKPFDHHPQRQGDLDELLGVRIHGFRFRLLSRSKA
ncbi:MAG: hypothetical protein V2G41_09530 [bacterium JZ-2024 1]